jgi:hypothetical protein
MTSLFFSCDVFKSLREVVPAENIVTQGPQTLKDAATDFLRASLADHSEFRDLPDATSLLAFVEDRVKVALRCAQQQLI